jgi:hypothetical protein
VQNLDLIDWGMVGFAGLWITGLALIVAALGFADYHAQQQGRGLRKVIQRRGYQITIDAALSLFCLGLMGSAGAWWETTIWGLLAAAFGYLTVQAVRSGRGGGEA